MPTNAVQGAIPTLMADHLLLEFDFIVLFLIQLKYELFSSIALTSLPIVVGE
jgi:hypothetical protein